MTERRRIKTHDLTRDDYDALPDDGKAFARAITAGYDKARLLRAYRRTKNGAHLWKLYRLLRATRQDIPDWLLEWLDDCADQLLEASTTSEAATAVGYLHPKGGDSHGNYRAERQLGNEYGLLQRYEMECERIGNGHPTSPKSKADVYNKLAPEFGTTAGAIKQKIRRLTK